MRGQRYILGLDLGVASIGWAALSIDEEGGPAGIIKTGIRLFDMMGDTQPDTYSSGMDASPTEERRAARLRRRQVQRHAKRRKRIFILLQKYGLLPAGNAKDAVGRSRFFAELDLALRESWFKEHSHDYQWRRDPDLLQIFPYKLRSAGITEPLAPHAFGRALYHLSQRRGFQSNRKEEAMLQALEGTPEERSSLSEEEKELGKVKAGIHELEETMCAAGAATVGQYLASLSPSHTRIRGRYTSRAMVKNEFVLLWERQRLLHKERSPDGSYPAWLRREAQNALEKAVFFQRPLKSQKGLVGRCSLEPGDKRSSFNCPEAQEFRLLQKLNDLAWSDVDLNWHRVADVPEQWAAAHAALMRSASVSFSALRKLLGLPRGIRFNFEQDKEDKLIGHRINARMLDAFGEDWFGFDSEKQAAILHDLLSIQKLEVLKKRALTVWGLDEAHARKFIRGFIDDGYCLLGKKALRKLLPEMRKGVSYGVLRPALYPPRVDEDAHDFLPPVMRVQDTLRNPAVIRCLTQLRKLMAALVRRYGKPEIIRVELARDMKKSREDRKKIAKNQKSQAKLRDRAKAKLESMGIPTPGRSDVEKLLLAEECGWRCPYTGKSIGWPDLFGSHPKFDVEHILPYSKVFDNSFLNKTLCCTEYNRKKGNRIPYEAAGGDSPEYALILERVKKLHSQESLAASVLGLGRQSFYNAEVLTRAKLMRFMAKDLSSYENFTSRLLNDTRHASRVAMEYLSLLYGEEALRRKCVQVGRGGVTAQLRGVWRLNEILGDGGEKSRDDHRHHAVDAVAIASTSPALMQRMQVVAADQERETGGSRLKLRGRLLPPWERFLDDVRSSVFSIVPSLSVRRRARGPLHNENPYARRLHPGTGEEVYAIRKSVAGIGNGRPTEQDVAKFSAGLLSNSKELRGKLYRELLEQPGGEGSGRVRAARVVQKPGTMVAVGADNTRWYANEFNHHTPVFARRVNGKEAWWSPGPVTLLEAMLRVQRKETLVNIVDAEGGRFLFSLASGDCIRVMYRDEEEFLKVRTVYMDGDKPKVEGTRLTDARTKKEMKATIKEDKAFFALSLKQLQEGGCRKIRVLPCGDVVDCNE